LTEAN